MFRFNLSQSTRNGTKTKKWTSENKQAESHIPEKCTRFSLFCCLEFLYPLGAVAIRFLLVQKALLLKQKSLLNGMISCYSLMRQPQCVLYSVAVAAWRGAASIALVLSEDVTASSMIVLFHLRPLLRSL